MLNVVFCERAINMSVFSNCNRLVVVLSSSQTAEDPKKWGAQGGNIRD